MFFSIFCATVDNKKNIHDQQPYLFGYSDATININNIDREPGRFLSSSSRGFNPADKTYETSLGNSISGPTLPSGCYRHTNVDTYK